MKYWNKKIIITLSVGLLCLPLLVSAQDKYGLGAAAGKAGLTTFASANDVPGIVGTIIGTALSMIGVLFLLLMLYGGFLWMTARGNEEQTKKALETIEAAVIGVIIVLGAYALTSFVFKSVGQGNGGGRQACPAYTGTDPLYIACSSKSVDEPCSRAGGARGQCKSVVSGSVSNCMCQ